jgi:serine/threonine protein phosphatase PrpC
MRLFLDIGHYEWSAKRDLRPGTCIATVADNAPEGGHGVLLACAEGVAGRPEAEHAARSVTTALGDMYYSAADDAPVRQTLEEALTAANNAIRASGDRGRAAVVAALVLQGRRWYAAHAGHVRVWRYRDLQIKQLTRDHVLPLSPGRTEVTRACGYGEAVDADHGEGELKESDIFLLTSPGVHDALPGSELLGILQSDGTAQQMAEALVQRALAVRAAAYAGVCIARIEKLPPASGVSRGSLLPLTELPAPGTEIDKFAIEKLIIKSRRFRLYKATDGESHESVALRFPDPSYPESAQTFLREEAIGRRVESPYLLKPISVRPGRRTALYAVVEYHKTESLAKRIRRKQGLPLEETIRLADQLLAALETLHGQGVTHGDVRPHNLLYDRHKRQIYLFGLMANRQEGGRALPSGSLSYHAPELRAGVPANERSEVYAAGVTVYRMLTGEYPYGKLRADTDWKSLEYVSITRHKAGLPNALDNALARACAIEPADRYSNVVQFAAALNAVQLANPGATSTTGTDGARTPAGPNRWAWGAAAGLVAALLGYLYAVFR